MIVLIRCILKYIDHCTLFIGLIYHLYPSIVTFTISSVCLSVREGIWNLWALIVHGHCCQTSN